MLKTYTPASERGRHDTVSLSGTFEDVNEPVGEEWEATTTPFQLIREVIATAYESLSAEIVAERARLSPKTAR